MTAEIKIRVFDTDSPAGRLQRITAEVYGQLAIHPTMCGDRWAITHIGTGYEVASTSDYEVAQQVVTELAALDWSFDKVATMPANTRVEAEMFLRKLGRAHPDLRSSARS